MDSPCTVLMCVFSASVDWSALLQVLCTASTYTHRRTTYVKHSRFVLSCTYKRRPSQLQCTGFRAPGLVVHSPNRTNSRRAHKIVITQSHSHLPLPSQHASRVICSSHCLSMLSVSHAVMSTVCSLLIVFSCYFCSHFVLHRSRLHSGRARLRDVPGPPHGLVVVAARLRLEPLGGRLVRQVHRLRNQRTSLGLREDGCG